MKKVLSLILALAMLISLVSFMTVSVSAEQSFIDDGVGFIGSHIDVSENWGMWAQFPNMTHVLNGGQWDIYVDPAVWNAIVSGVLFLDYSDYADAIQYFAQADMALPGSIYSVIGASHIAPGVVDMVINALDMNMVRNAETGHLGWMRFTFQVINFERFQYHLLNSENNVISIGIGFGNSAGVQGAGGHYDIGGSLVGAAAGDNVNLWEHFDNAAPSTFAILDPITIGRNLTVTFDVDGGTPAPAAQTVLFGGNVILPTEPTKDGYDFEHWAVQDGGTLVPWNFESPALGDMTLVAVWVSEGNVTRHQVTFDADGGTPVPPSQNVVEGQPVTRPTNPQKEGYGFRYWAVDDGDGNLVEWNFTNPVNGPIDLIAVWEVRETNRVYFDAGEGVTNPPPQDVPAGGRVTRPTPDPERPGHYFVYWAVDDGTGNLVEWNFNDPITDDTTLVAVWDPEGTVRHEVSFDAGQGVTNPPNQRVIDGQPARRPTPDPQRPGLDFRYWAVDDGNGNLVEWNFNNPITDDTVLVAVWDPNDDFGSGFLWDEDFAWVGGESILAGNAVNGQMVNIWYDLYVDPRDWHTGVSARLIFGFEELEDTINFDASGVNSAQFGVTTNFDDNEIALNIMGFQHTADPITGFVGRVTFGLMISDVDLLRTRISEAPNGQLPISIQYGVTPDAQNPGEYYEDASYLPVGWDTLLDAVQIKDLDPGHTYFAPATIGLGYSVIFHANGGVGSMFSQNVFYGVDTTLRANEFTNGDYIFNRWSTTPYGVGTRFADEAIVTFEDMAALADSIGQVHLFAIWSLGFDVEYNPNGGVDGPPTSEDIDRGTDYTLSDIVPTHDPVGGVNVEFVGWTLDREVAELRIYTKDDEVPAGIITEILNLQSDMVVYAIWGFDTTGNGVPDVLETIHTIVFNANGGTGTMANLYVSRGTSRNLPGVGFSRTNQVFDGWNTQANGNGSNVANLANVTSAFIETHGVLGADGESRTLTLFARWRGTGGTGGGTGGGGWTFIPSEPVEPDSNLNTEDHFAYIVGYLDGSIRPANNITRAEVSTIFFRLLRDEVRNVNITTNNEFSDVPDGVWFNLAISTMARLGYVRGDWGLDTFRPNDYITRAEFATLAARFDSREHVGEDRFPDIAGHWAANSINRAAQRGWITGYLDGTFMPDQFITRAEAITLINRVLGRDRVDASSLHPDMVTWWDNEPGTWYYFAIQEATNSHEYTRDAAGFETWTAIVPNRDWIAIERYWLSN